MPPKAKPARPARDLLTVELDPGTRAELKSLCEEYAAKWGGNPDRLASPVIRRLIRVARKLDALD